MNQPQKFFKSLLCSRSRGDQVLRVNPPPRPPKDDTTSLAEIQRLIAKSEKESKQAHYASSLCLLSKAKKIAGSLETITEDALRDLTEDIDARKERTNKKLEKQRRRSSRRVANATQEASQPS